MCAPFKGIHRYGWAAMLLVLLLLAGCDNDDFDFDGDDDAAAPSAFPVQVGEVGPTAESNALQQPFGCQTFETTLGQPQVDNQEGIGYPVTDPGGPAPEDHSAINPANIVGYSANCGAPTRVDYYYRSTADGDLKPLEDVDDLPNDLATIEIDGEQVNYIVRHELGTINRFIYSVYLLTPNPTGASQPDLSAWNRNLVYYFGGGVGVGYSQSENNSYVDRPDGRDLTPLLLESGYAVIASTGTVTSTTYNLVLMGQTAVMVKRQFETSYADPDHTFGVGGSGGAIQQYIYEQNHPELLDALMPQETFGDQITQFNPIGDCELLEFYFDRADPAVRPGGPNPKWRDWENRQLIEGLHAINGFPTSWDILNDDGIPIGSSAQPGSSECIEGWRGLTALTLNPHFVTGDAYELIRVTQPEVFADTPFTYADDLKQIFGINPETGFAGTVYDNVGVQYGLEALNAGDITVQEFLLLNAHVGGWKDTDEIVPPGFPYDPTADEIDPWGSRNATAVNHLNPGDVAPRAEGDLGAMRAAYEAGLVFLGDIDDPMLILDSYQELELDMHHSREKFEIRERMLAVDGDASNLVLWAIEKEDETVIGGLTLEVLDLLETWLETGMKPVAARDACFTTDGTEIARGDNVWNGVLTMDDPSDDAVCAERFPIYGSPRTVAGAPITGDIFKCQLKAVDTALTDGTYGDNVTFSDAQITRLNEIFATGVCDYDQPDRARPDGLLG